jgi:uncharacterized membrane protein YgcG
MSAMVDRKVLISLAISTVVTAYVYHSVKSQVKEKGNLMSSTGVLYPPAVHAGGTATRVFFVAFLTTYILLRMIDYAGSSSSGKKTGGGDYDGNSGNGEYSGGRGNVGDVGGRVVESARSIAMSRMDTGDPSF